MIKTGSGNKQKQIQHKVLIKKERKKLLMKLYSSNGTVGNIF